MKTKLYAAGLFSCLVSATAQASITIDGKLDEPEWQEAQVFNDFVTVEPLTSDAAKYPTQVKILSNDEGIFVGFTNTQPPSVPRVQRRFARDSEIKGDRNTVAIDFDGNGLAGYDFTVGISNSIQDGIFAANSWSSDWDGTWYSQTSTDQDNWYSEIHIPWSVAPMSKSDIDLKTMKIWFSRIVYNESLRFAYPNASNQRNTFIQDWKPIQLKQYSGYSLDWFPYISYNNDLEHNETDWNAGLDMVWRPDSNTQITGAINPDFGQVESDDLVVNFSAFETFRAEKRPFFTENQALFTNNMPNNNTMVHTRRIGASSDAGDEAISDINLAAKYSHYGEHTDYGVFAVIEDDSRLSDGREFLSTRIQSQLNGLTLGHRFTYVDRTTLDRTAMVNALDFDAQLSDKARLKGELLYSDIDQQANTFNQQSQLSQQGFAGWIDWTYDPSDIWQHQLLLFHFDDDFEMNDMGFMERNDLTELFGYSQHNILNYGDDSSLQSSYTAFKYGYQKNTQGDKLSTWAEIEQNYTFNSTQEVGWDFGAEVPAYDDRITRGNGLYYRPVQIWSSVNFQTVRSGNFSMNTRLAAYHTKTDKLTYELSFEPEFYVTEFLTLSGSAEYKHFNEWLIWDFDTEQLASFESQHLIKDLRLDWYPSTKQEVRLKFQWVSVTADALSGHQLSGSGRISPSTTPVSDFSFSDTALQIRYRYQLAPLSDIFLVYSRGGYYDDESSDRSPASLLDEGWDNKIAESFIAKVRYRF